MSPQRAMTPITAVVLTGLALAATVYAGESSLQSTFGSSFFSSSPRCPVNQFPTFENVAPVPAIIDPFAQDIIPFFCQIQVDRGADKPVRNARGRYTSELVVLDNNTGQTSRFFIEDGKFKTGEDGRDSFDFDIPTAIFADGFESGDVSAWSYTRSDFTNKKKANNAAITCFKTASKSN